VEIDINDVVNGQILNAERNFIIAHSMGGLVARTLGQMTEPTTSTPLYNGLITIGTPHQGAFAANTLVENPQAIDDVLTNACQKLGAGPAKEGINNSGVLGSLAILFGFGGGILNNACEAAVDAGFPLVSSFAQQGVEAELTTTAASAIPDMPTDHKAVFYGIEDGHDDETLTPRFIGALLPESSPNEWPLYQADGSDAAGIAEVAEQLDFYVTRMNFWQGLHDAQCGWWPLCWTSAEPIADAYREGVNWFDTLDPTWQELIGASQTGLVQVGCDYYDYDGIVGSCTTYLGFDPNCGGVSNPFACEYPVYEMQTVRELSDGFILAESAMNGPGMNYDAQFMDGSNHMQMKNDSEMELAVIKIFIQGLGGEFFKTEER
jgi:pimeloyl-ACP methyl ester carboxylesterase